MQKYNLTCREKDTRLTGTPSNESLNYYTIISCLEYVPARTLRKYLPGKSYDLIKTELFLSGLYMLHVEENL